MPTSATPPGSIASWRSVDGDRDARDLFERLAVVEDRHTARWEELFADAGRPLPALSHVAAHAGPRLGGADVRALVHPAADPG